MLAIGSGSSQLDRPAVMPSAKELKRRAQKRSDKKRPASVRDNNRQKALLRKQRKSFEAIDGPLREKVSLREKHGVII